MAYKTSTAGLAGMMMIEIQALDGDTYKYTHKDIVGRLTGTWCPARSNEGTAFDSPTTEARSQSFADAVGELYHSCIPLRFSFTLD